MSPSPGTPNLGYIVCALSFVQMYTGVCYNMPAIYAPDVTDKLGVAAQSVGVFLGIVMVACLGGGLINSQLLRRVGAWRMCQIAVFFQAVGVGLAASGSLFWLIVSAIIIGIGNGTVVPATVQTLMRAAPPGRIATYIALTQLGPPIGAALAGATIPSLLEAFGWQRSLIPMILVGLAITVALQPLRATVDRELDPHFTLRFATLFSPWALAFRDRALRSVGLVSLTMAFIASVNGAFLVSYLNLELKYSLFLAGLVLTSSQVGVMAGRILIGWVADRVRDPLPLLRWLTLATGALTVLMGLLAYGGGAWGFPLVVLTITVSQSWFAVFLAAAARYAPPGKSAMATAGVQVFPITATTIGPIVFAAIVSLSERYSSAYLICGTAAVIIGAFFLLSSRRRVRRAAAEQVR